MPGLTSSLNIGLSGLQAAQGALNVVGHNIANVNTPNYSRQRAELVSNQPQQFGTLEFGTGVNLGNILGVRDKFLDLQITQSMSRQSGANARYSGVEGISSIFEEDGTTGLSSLVENFYSAFQQLSARPEDGAVRTNILGQAQSLVNGIQSRYQLLEGQRSQANQNIASIVAEVNSLTTQIADLNDRISSEPSQGADSDGRDQRQALANRLAELVGVQVFEDNHNRLQITLDSGSATLVGGSQAYAMVVTPDAALSNHYRVDVDMGGAVAIDVTGGIKDGSLGANLALRDSILPNYQAQLDQLAAGIYGGTNLVHRAGYALDGVTLGTDFFQGAGLNGANGLPGAVLAANGYRGMVNAMSINTAVINNHSLIAAAGAAGSPGDNTNARALANLQNATSAVDTDRDGAGDSGPFSTVISSLVNKIGTDSQSFKTISTSQDNLLAALKTQRDRISGVDLDEEATAMLSFQRSYQASAHFISVIDQLTQQLISQFAT